MLSLPEQVCALVARQYPGVWRTLDEFRARRGRSLPDWPDWCFIPMAGPYAVVSGGGDNRVPPGLAMEPAVIAATAAWRPTQRIYRLDATLQERLCSTPLTGDIPSDVLLALPRWGVYVELAEPIHGAIGFFAHLEFDPNDNSPELRILGLSGPTEITDLTPIHLHSGSLVDSLRRCATEALTNAERLGMDIPVNITTDDGFMRRWAERVSPFVSIALYLCAENADIQVRDGEITQPEPKKTKRGLRVYPPRRPITMDVGARIGERLRSAERQSVGDGDRRGPRPHVRRAHWHTYRVGPGRTRTVVRWLVDMLVGDSGE